MTPEGKVKAKVRQLLRDKEIHYNHIPASQFGKAGAADYICCVNGFYLAIECKAGKGSQTMLQQVEQNRIEKAGGLYLVIDETNMDRLEKVINYLMSRNDI